MPTNYVAGNGSDPAPSGHRPRRTALLIVALLAAVAIMGGAVAVAFSPGTDSALAVGSATGRLAGQATAPGPAAGISVSSPTTLPIPDALPADPRAPTDVVVVADIEIPKIGVDEDVRRSITLTSIDRGPGWWPGTALPGELGNMVVAGHRVTHSKPFNRLDELVEGDQVIFTTDAGRFTYEVRGVITVPADWIDIAAQDAVHTATLFACHPKGAATHRIVAKLRLLNDDGSAVDPDAELPALHAEELATDHTLLVRVPEGNDVATGNGPLDGVDG